MKSMRIPSPDGNGYYNLTEIGDVEYGNPTEIMRNGFITLGTNMYVSAIKLSLEFETQFDDLKNRDQLILRAAAQKALSDWEEISKEIFSVKIPTKLFQLLNEPKKRNQIKALKGIRLNSDKLLSFFCTAHDKYGYAYSVYRAEHVPTGIDPFEIPRFAYKQEDGTLLSTGGSSYSEGQIRSIIEQRSVTFSRFLDKGSEWHCFFYTYRSIFGKEVKGTPHIHYISSAWGLSREEVLMQLRSKNYKLPPVPHIPYGDS